MFSLPVLSRIGLYPTDEERAGIGGEDEGVIGVKRRMKGDG